MNSGPLVDPRSHLRIARPSKDLTAAELFYVDGLGMDILFRHDGDDYDLRMLGWRSASWHLELAHSHTTEITPTPTGEDLLVVYLDNSVPAELVSRLVVAGGRRVAAENPYWDRWGVTIEDPDGYRLVLCERSWTNTGVRTS